jgi:hypothetical protein
MSAQSAFPYLHPNGSTQQLKPNTDYELNSEGNLDNWSVVEVKPKPNYPYQTMGQFRDNINSNLNTLNQRIDSVANMLPKEICYQQDYSSAYASAAILGYTFYVLQKNGTYMSPETRGQIAFTGMLTSVGTYFLLSHIKNKYRHSRCIDKQSLNTIYYEPNYQNRYRQDCSRTATSSRNWLSNTIKEKSIFRVLQTPKLCRS